MSCLSITSVVSNLKFDRNYAAILSLGKFIKKGTAQRVWRTKHDFFEHRTVLRKMDRLAAEQRTDLRWNSVFIDYALSVCTDDPTMETGIVCGIFSDEQDII